MEDAREYWSDILEKTTGKQIMVDTIDCVTYKMEHKNCKECPHHLQCAKLAAILTVQQEVSTYRPRDFIDQMMMKKQATVIVEHILEAKTSEELKEII